MDCIYERCFQYNKCGVIFTVTGKRVQIRKRRLIKDFSIGLMEVCTDEAAPEVTSNKGVLARLVGLSNTETRGSQRWKDLIQAAKKSKIIGNTGESGRFGSLRRSRSEEETTEEKEPEKTDAGFQKSEKAEAEPPPTNRLYPNIPEEDFAPSSELSVPPITTQPMTKRPLGSPILPKTETLSPRLDSKDSLSKGIKLSPEVLIKQIVKKEKYPAPKPNIPDVKESFSPSKGSSVNVSLKNSENLQQPSLDLNLKTDAVSSTPSNCNMKCQDTTITVTSSPEKTASPRDNTMTSVEIDSADTSPELIDLNENHDSSAIINIPVMSTNNQNGNIDTTQYLMETNENNDSSISMVSTSEYLQSPKRSDDQISNSNEDQVVQLDGSNITPQPPPYERQGWL